MKKILALVLVAAMMMATLSVFADIDNLNQDQLIYVSGLDASDTAEYYQVLEWKPDLNGDNVDDNDKGWWWAGAYATEAAKDSGATLTETDLDDILAGNISYDLANRIAAISATAMTPAGSNSNGTWTASPAKAGLYMVAITAGTSGVIYNPVFVSSNWYRDDDDKSDNNTWAVTSEDLSYSPTSMAKKKEITVTKTADEYSHDVGNEVVTFTVNTEIPNFPENYTKPQFKVQDTLTGMNYEDFTETGNFEVKAGNTTLNKATGYDDDLADGAYYFVSSTATSFQIAFTKAYLESVTGASQAITLTYKAKVTADASYETVNQDKNDVVVSYSNSPSDEQGNGRMKDETNHFTFSIDVDLLGNSGKSSSEIVKVGLSEDGVTPIEEVITTYESQEPHAALEGAVFALYTDSDCTTVYTNDSGMTFDNITTDGNGLLSMTGLDANTNYYLKELKAPAGYVKYKGVITVRINATITTETVEVTETVDNVEVTYKTNKLESYEVVFTDAEGNVVKTKYTITNDGPTTSEATRVDSSDAEVKNLKGAELPSTGGIGTYLFYAIGGIMMLAAGIILVSRKRADD